MTHAGSPFPRSYDHLPDALDTGASFTTGGYLPCPQVRHQKCHPRRKWEAMIRTQLRAGLVCTLACGTLITAVALNRHDGGSAPAAAAAALPETTTTPVPTRTATATAAPAPAQGAYVALGDSYTAGPGIPSQIGEPGGCDRSDRNYPTLIAENLDLEESDFTDMSCSGATIADLSSPQSTGDGVNPAQFSALSATTRLVTIGIGGNDIGFTSVVNQCVRAGVLYNALAGGTSNYAPCKRKYVSAGTDEVHEKIQAAGQQLSVALGEITRRAPQADVYIVGYPAILPTDGVGCARTMGLTTGDITYLRQKEQELNTMLQQQAEAAGAGYIDTYTPSLDRDACAPRDIRWVEPLIPLNPAASVHPNERGERGMADAILQSMSHQTPPTRS